MSNDRARDSEQKRFLKRTHAMMKLEEIQGTPPKFLGEASGGEISNEIPREISTRGEISLTSLSAGKTLSSLSEEAAFHRLSNVNTGFTPAEEEIVDLLAMSESESDSSGESFEEGMVLCPDTPPISIIDLTQDPDEDNDAEQDVAAATVRPVKFRLSAKKLALTFPQCSMAPEEMMRRIKHYWGEDAIKWCVVAQETHTLEGLHLHVGLWLKKTHETRDANSLDVLAGQHGDYKTMYDPVGWVEYIIKEQLRVVSFNIDPVKYLEARKKKKSVTSLEVGREILDGTSVRELAVKFPGFALRNLGYMLSYESYLSGAPKAPEKKWDPEFSVDSPTPSESEVLEWLKKNLFVKRKFGQHQLLITGPTSHGKTTLVNALACYCRIYYVPMGEDFYDSYDDKSYDLAVFDEFRHQKKITWMNQFLDGQPLTLRRKGGQINKRKRLPVIVLSNYEPHEMFAKVAQEHPAVLETFKRRFLHVRLGCQLQDGKRDDLFRLAEALMETKGTECGTENQ